MTSDRWRHLKDVFYNATDLPLAERDGFLARECGDDPELEASVRRMLAESEGGSGFLDGPAGDITALPRLVYEEASRAGPGNLRTFEDGTVVGGRFKIVKFHAHGGMGEVYEAYDSELRETVALKTILPEHAWDAGAIERFKTEVSRARRISSQHVCRVHDLFTHRMDSGDPVVFLTMELLEGETLAQRLARRGRLSPEEALPLLRQIGEGLEAAHRTKIVHQDLKTSNVMLVPGDNGTTRSVILDFGMARRAAGTGTLDGADPVGGSPAYMAPEQFEGKPVTRAADIYSMGVVAYEMVSGCRPFEGATTQAIALRRLNETPASPRTIVPDLPLHWESAIMRCLELEPDKRFTSAGELVKTLEGSRSVWWRGPALAIAAMLVVLLAIAGFLVDFGRGPAAPANSIAVLPFTHIGAQQDSDYYLDGITEELIHTLTNNRNLHVTARESSFQFKASSLPLREIGKQLGVRALLTGSARRSNGRVRIIVNLVNSSNGFQLWSGAFEKPESDLLSIHDEIARSVAGAFDVQLAGAQSIETRRARNPETYERILMGRFFLNKRTDENIRKALEYFETAVEKDASSATAYLGLADTYSIMASRSLLPPREALAKAKAAAEHGLALDSNLADGYVSLGQVTSLYDHDFAAAERQFQRALEINPNLVTAHHWYSYLLMKLRRFEEAHKHAVRALELDPLSYPLNVNLALLYFFMGDDDQTIKRCNLVVEMYPGRGTPYIVRAMVLARRGRAAEAWSELEAINDRPKDDPMVVRARGEVGALLGRRDLAEQALSALAERRASANIPSSYLAIIHARLGQIDEAFTWLERAWAEADGLLPLLPVYPAFDSLRSDPRYAALLTRLGFTGQTASGSVPSR